jgi:PKD repeat protein
MGAPPRAWRVSDRRRTPWIWAASLAVVAGLLITAFPTSAGPPSPRGPASYVLPRLPATAAARSGLAAGATPQTAQADWINITNTAAGRAPPLLVGGSSAYDPVDRETVYFGGCLQNGPCPSNETWVFVGGIWVNETNPLDAPPARTAASMDFDANMNAILLFGGRGASQLFNDTWTFRGGVWTNITYVSFGPSPREGASLAFDPQPGENGSVLFGGCYPAFGYDCFNDTWLWRGWGGWERIGPSSGSLGPIAVGFAAMAYDPAVAAVVLFGGLYGFGDLNGQTWEFYSGQWWATYPATEPDGCAWATAVYSPALGGLLLFGGWNDTLLDTSTTWLFSQGDWSLLATAHSPSPRDWYGLALDGTGTTPILVGGENLTEGVDFNDTWALEVPPSAGLTENTSVAEVSQPVTFASEISGGTAPFDATFQFGDSTSVSVVEDSATFALQHSFDHPGNYTISSAFVDSVGVPFSGNALLVTVTPGPAISASSTPSSGDVGTVFSFRGAVNVSGTPPLGFAWQFGDGGSAAGVNSTHSYSAPGVYRVFLNATDGVGATASTSLLVTVAPPPSVSFSTAPTAPAAGTGVGFVASVAGGTAPFTYAWRFGDGGSSPSASPEHNYSYGGTYEVQVWVNDSTGNDAHASSSLVVSGSSGPTTSTAASSYPIWFWLGLAGLLVLAGVVVALLVRRDRARRTPP